MKRLLLISVILLLPALLAAQIRVSTLVIKSGESFDLGQSDILVADTLIMQDSSTLILNKLKKENFVRAQVVIFGNHCTIDGRGVNGKPGRDGGAGNTPIGPCQPGTPGKNASKGLDGTSGVNLFLYLDHVTIKGKVIIDLSGGNGGRGGTGGAGGSGSPGTVHCKGGDGANGGNAGQGGNGANGGTLTLSSKRHPNIQEWIGSKILVKNAGGTAGISGRAGYHGSAGLGPSRKNGKDGQPGFEGNSGLAGIRGTINFEAN
jgi:hypothetical protein